MTTLSEKKSEFRESQFKHTKLLTASVAGASLEFYDFFIYGAAASIVFPKLFFPTEGSIVGLLLALGTYAIGYANRPLGAMLFGHIGDRTGRKAAFTAALLTMGIATFLVGALPAYNSIGLFAPVILLILRFAQGLGLGGAWGGAAVMVTEAYPKDKRGFYGSLVQEASPIGLLLGIGIFSLFTTTLSSEAFESWGWRIPFFISALLVYIGLYTHKVVEESPLYEKIEEKKDTLKVPLRELVANHKKELTIAVLSRFGSDATFYVFGLFALVYVTEYLHLSRSLALNCVAAGAIAQLIGIPFFGWLSDRIGRRPVLMLGMMGCIVWAFFHFPLLDTKNPQLCVVASFIGLLIHAATWAPIAAFLSELFSTHVRYSGTAVGFQLAAVIGGALAPIIATSLALLLPHGLAISLYVAVIMAIGLVVVAFMRETSGKSFDSD